MSEQNEKVISKPNKKTRPYNSTESKDRIKKAAIWTFSRNGFKGTTVRTIAKRAKVNIAMIDRYFGGKNELFEVLMRDFVDAHKSRELPYPPQKNLKEEIRLFLSFRTNEVAQDVPFARMLLSQALIDPKHKQKFEEIVIRREDEHLAARLKLLEEQDLLPKKSESQALTSIVSTYLCGLHITCLILFSRSEAEIERDIENFCNQL